MSLVLESLVSPKVDLIVAAERLFGTFGVEGVSLRRVSEEAGNRNVAAAQYHFGTKDKLLEAILLYRRPTIEAHRRLLLREWNVTPEEASIEQIVRAIASSLFEQGNDDPSTARSFCRFLRSLMQFEFYREAWENALDAAPITARLLASLRAHLSYLPDDLAAMRVLALGKFVSATIADYDRDPVTSRIPETRFLDDVVTMATAGYAVPAPGAVLSERKPDR
jgi:AcrR family transcriptional regulator